MPAESYTFLQNIFSTVDSATGTYISSTVSNVAAAVAPVAKQCFTLYVILWGFAMYRGLISEPIVDGAFRLMRVGIIMHFAISAGEYSGMIGNNLIALPDYLTNLIGNGGTASDSKLVLDTILSDTINVGNTLWESGSLLPPDANPGAYFMAMTVWASALICTGYAAFLIVLSKVALAVVVAMGPIFICCLMFEGTKKFFEAWLGQALNYALVSGLTVSVIKLLFGMYANVAAGTLTASDGAEFSFASVASLLILSVICFLILMQVQTIASALAGGVSISTMGAVNWGIAKSSSAARGANRTANSLRPSQMQKSYERMKAGAKADYRAAAAPVAWAHRKLSGGNSVAKAA
jgi:type IV secretion system protein VirB6